MNAQMFLANFGHIASAPEGVKRIREMILQFAIAGKLTVQKDNEHALKFLSLLKTEKQEITQRTIINLSTDGEKPFVFPIPSNWAWTYLGSLSENIHYGVTAKAVNRKNGVRFLRITDIQNDRVDWTNVPSCDIEEKQLSSSQLREGDILIARTGGTIGKTYLVENLSQHAVFASYLIRFIPLKSTYSKYIKLFTNSPLYWRQLREASSGTGQPNVNATALKALQIPIPPVEEQKRIVAKVDELMALCDKLEAQQQERKRLFPVLSHACHARFTESPTLANLKAIFAETETVSPDDLRKTILNLAIQGKLVPQDPTDEPAASLITKIITHKAEFLKSKKFRGSISVISSEMSEDAFELPPTWVWVRFGEIMINRDGERIPVSKEERASKAKTYDYYGASGVIDKIDSYLFDKPLLLIGEDGANLINRSTPIAFIARGKYWVNNHAHVLDGISEDFLRYIELHINAINLESYVTGTAQPKMNQAKMNSIPIALPPHEEQRRIVAKVDQLMSLIDQLEGQQYKNTKVVKAFAQAAVSAITGIQIKERERMKVPKTELVSKLQAESKPKATDNARLTNIIAKNKGELTAKSLWHLSGLEIGAFYQQLKTEMANGWIVELEKAVMKEVEAN